jgi:acetyl-CoA carboxylase biotin carboxyl carrier protein
MRPVARSDITNILQAFEGSCFAHLTLSFDSVQIAVNRDSMIVQPLSDVALGATEIVAPVLGMFQAGAEPGAPAFVQPGAEVWPDTTVAMIRVLNKVMMVKAGLQGTVVEIQARDGQLVEYGQTLLRVSAAASAQNSDRLASGAE